MALAAGDHPSVDRHGHQERDEQSECQGAQNLAVRDPDDDYPGDDDHGGRAGPGCTPHGDGEGVVRREMAGHYPHLAEIARAAAHDGASVVGPDCDQQFEFEFALDLLLDGFERLRRQRWTSGDQRRQLHEPRQLERQAGEQA